MLRIALWTALLLLGSVVLTTRAQESNSSCTSGGSSSSCACPSVYDPVCGSDGKTYTNTCGLQCAQKCDKKLRRVSKGKCKKVNNSSSPCPEGEGSKCACTDEYSPVCGSDRRTYSNSCQLKCAQHCNKKLKRSYPGECRQSTLLSTRRNTTRCVNGRPKSCSCTADYSPVCGSNKKTFSNRCELDCARKCSSKLKLAYQGECRKSSNSNNNNSTDCDGSKPTSCFCTEEYDPVCGSNRKTYSNPCFLNCDQKCNPKLRRSYKGECRRSSSSTTSSSNPAGNSCTGENRPSCICTEVYQPVCGSDGNTYRNDCDFNCTRDKCDPKLRKAYNGSCRAGNYTTKKAMKGKTRKTTTKKSKTAKKPLTNKPLRVVISRFS